MPSQAAGYLKSLQPQVVTLTVGVVAANANAIRGGPRIYGGGAVSRVDFLDATAITGATSDHPTWVLQKSSDAGNWTTVATLDFITNTNSVSNIACPFTLNTNSQAVLLNHNDYIRAMVNVTNNTIATTNVTTIFVHILPTPDYGTTQY